MNGYHCCVSRQSFGWENKAGKCEIDGKIIRSPFNSGKQCRGYKYKTEEVKSEKN